MAKILIIGPFDADGMKLFEARPEIALEITDGGDLSELAEQIRDADAVTIRTALLPAAAIEQAERLKVVSRHGVGYDNIDVDALTARKIPLAIAADANATAVAEHTLYFMLALAKQGLRYDRATREGRWAVRNSLEAVDLLGRRVLVMGFGRSAARSPDAAPPWHDGHDPRPLRPGRHDRSRRRLPLDPRLRGRLARDRL